MYEALLAGHILCAVMWVGGGILLVGEAGYEHSQLWVSLAYLVWLISLVLGAVVYPAMVKRVQEVGPGTEEGLVRVRRMVNLNSIEIGLLLLVVIDMAVKPGV